MHQFASSISTMAVLYISVFAALGGIWRWWDGRGYGPNWLRMGTCGVLAALALLPVGLWAIPLGAVFAAIWSFRQKNREEWDDMAIRWLLPLVLFGAILALVTGDLWAPIIMAVAGGVVSALVWAGTHIPSRFTLGLDPTAVSEAASGAIAFGALAAVAV